MALDLARSREFSDQLLNWIHGKGKVLIVSHDNPDPDSLAAAMALKHLLLQKTGQDAVITYGGIIGRGENQAMARELEIAAVHVAQLDLEQFKVVCMVDTQPGTGNNSYPSDRPVHLVIDHHHPRDICQTCRWSDVRENYGASATILLEYLLAQEVSFGTKLATMLYYAIKSETQDLGRDWIKADRDAYLYLLPLVNNRILRKITHPKVPRSYFQSYNRAIENSLLYDELLVFNLYQVHNPDIVAEMADFLLRVEGVEVVLGMGHYQDQEILSLRTDRADVFAGEIIRRVIQDLGTAGGHHMTAGGQIKQLKGDPAVQKELENRLTSRLLDILKLPHKKGEPLIP
jgi:nanoRNase/pAp phosphatase (c-di-AMP/oligoRNAs hydrolase)